MSKVTARRWALVSVVGLALAGCSGGTADEGPQEGDDGDGGESIALTLWHSSGPESTPTGKPIYDLVDRYVAEHPGITIEVRDIPYGDFYRTVIQGAASGDLPDILQLNASDTVSLADANVVQDIGDRVDAWGEQDAYFPGVWDTTQANGSTYSLPFFADCYALYYNKDMFEAAGMEPPATWDELETVAVELTGDGVYGLAASGIEGIEGSTALLLRILAEGGTAEDIDTDAGRTALTQFKALVDEGSMSQGMLTWGETDVKNEFANGKAAMMIDSATDVGIVRDEAPDLNFGVVPMPKSTTEATFLAATNIAMSTATDHPEEVWEFLTYVQQPDVLLEYLPDRNKVSPREDIAEEVVAGDAERLVFAQELSNAWAPSAEVAPKANEVFTYIQQALQAAISGTASVEQALSDAQRNIDSALGR